MTRFWFRLLLVLATVAALAAAGCQKKQTPGESKQPEVGQSKQASAPAETTKSVQSDTTAPQPPPGYKSIHQLELEEHKQAEKKEKH